VTPDQAQSFASNNNKPVGKTKRDKTKKLDGKPSKPPLSIKITLPLHKSDQQSPRVQFGINSPRQVVVEEAPKEEKESLPVTTMPLSAPWRHDQLLPPILDHKKGKKCLILDLDETLVHSSFQDVECHYRIPVDIEGTIRTIYVSKRPHVDEFLSRCGQLFEVVVFTASLAKYADPLLDLLDVNKVIDHRLFRESCTPHCGIYVKDLFRMGRPLEEIIIIDNSPHSYAFNPQNAIPCKSWFDDHTDTELLDLLQMLQTLSDKAIKNVMTELEVLQAASVALNPYLLPGDGNSDEGGGEEAEGKSGAVTEVYDTNKSNSESTGTQVEAETNLTQKSHD